MIYYITHYFTVGIFIGTAIGMKLKDFIWSNPQDNTNPSISDIENAFKLHNQCGPIPSHQKPVMYNKLKYINLYHTKMTEFYNEMMTIENDGFNPLSLSL
jgi:hypothetical protein